MAAPFPSETIDGILDHLHDDRSALAACSLASSIFVPSCRHHLFSEVVLECSGICTFLRLLDVPWSTIAPAINRLVISERRSLRGTTRNKKGGFYIPENPVRLRARMRNVRSVRFSDISLADIPPPFWRLLNDLKTVKELEAHQMTFDSSADFFQYICSLPALEALSITKSSWEVQPGDIAQFQTSASFCIPLLDVGKHSQHAVLEWFLAQQPVPPVHTFRINLDTTYAITSTIRQYIDAAGSAIQHLHINIPSGIPDVKRLNAIDLSPCTNLRSVQIEGLRIGQQAPAKALEDFMASLFSQIRAPSLTEVSFALYMEPAGDALSFFGIPDHVLLQSWDWGKLPDILDGRFGFALQKLSVEMRGCPKYEHKHTAEFLKKGPFKLFEGRGVLHVDFPAPLLHM